jgi:hypothetical protein
MSFDVSVASDGGGGGGREFDTVIAVAMTLHREEIFAAIE